MLIDPLTRPPSAENKVKISARDNGRLLNPVSCQSSKEIRLPRLCSTSVVVRPADAAQRAGRVALSSFLVRHFSPFSLSLSLPVSSQFRLPCVRATRRRRQPRKFRSHSVTKTAIRRRLHRPWPMLPWPPMRPARPKKFIATRSTTRFNFSRPFHRPIFVCRRRNHHMQLWESTTST